MNILRHWFSRQTEQIMDDSHNPWAGLASYEDPEKAERTLIFCGRDDDSYDVTKLIMGNIFVTLYGKSGIGKTSLLNAGVFPELREGQYTPLSLRLGMRDKKNPNSYQSIIINSVKRSIRRIETINIIEEQTDENAIDYLWNFFARHRFFDMYDEPTSPVVVFDQFEEVFRTNRDEVETLLRQLDYINDKDHTLDNCVINDQNYRYETNFRFVVSIREDDLYRLEDSIDNCYLPALKRCRYRLRSLSEQGARDVICIPGKGLFRDEEQESIVQTIIQIARNKEDQTISTNLLSLICNRLYVDYQRRQGIDQINQTLVDNFIKDNPFELFYNEATRGFSNREKNYIEDHFVDSTGRRNSLPESDFLLHVKNGARLLEGNTRILQRISTSSDGGSYRVELIHDSFCEPLAFLKGKRERRNRIKWIAAAAAIFILMFGIIGSILYLYNRNQTHEGTIASQKTTIAIERDSLKRANNTLELLQAMNKQKEEELVLKQQELKKTNEEYYLKNLALAQRERELAKINKEISRIHTEKNELVDELEKYKNDISRIQTEKNELEVELEKYKTGQASADLDLTYIYDGVRFLRYGFFQQDDLNKWKVLNEEVCRRKIPHLLNDSPQALKIPKALIEREPGLVYLILTSPSISGIDEKQSWFNLWSIMSEEQVFKLYDILARERYKLCVLEYKDNAAMLNNAAYAFANDGNYSEAIGAIDESITITRVEYANKFDSKGEILLMKGDTTKAVEMWYKVIDIAPDFLDYYNGSTPFYEQLRKYGLIR